MRNNKPNKTQYKLNQKTPLLLGQKPFKSEYIIYGEDPY